jgi:HAD superfamily hydrolase (TIGR01509 family)
MNKLAIFDMDGLLVDSEPLHMKAWSKAFLNQGLDLSREDYITDMVQGGKNLHEHLKTRALVQECNLEKVVETMGTEKWNHYADLIVAELELKEGARELLECLSGKLKMVVASSSRKASLDLIVDKFGIRKYFDEIISDSGLENRKPHPEIFLRAATAVSVEPRDCVVLEDAEKGLKAAKAAGMKCIICLDEISKDGDFSNANLIVKSLNEVNYKIVKNL